MVYTRKKYLLLLVCVLDIFSCVDHNYQYNHVLSSVLWCPVREWPQSLGILLCY